MIGWTTDELATSRVDYGTSPDSLNLSASSASLVATHALTLTGLASNTTYYYRVTSVDAASNSATSPILTDPPLSFVSLATPLITNVVATSAGDGLSASVTWTTDVPATSRVDYGTSAGALTQNVSTRSARYVPQPDASGAHPGHPVLLPRDVGGCLRQQRDLSRFPRRRRASPRRRRRFLDDTAADFGAGTTGTSTLVTTSVNGEVTLKPAASADFATLPSDQRMAGVQLADRRDRDGRRRSADRGRRSLQHRARRDHVRPRRDARVRGHVQQRSAPAHRLRQGNRPGRRHGHLQHLPDAGVQHRCSSGSAVITRAGQGGRWVLLDFTIPLSLIGSAHLYRIEWKSASLDFYVDGSLVHSEPITLTSPMRPGRERPHRGRPALFVDWIQATPYASSGSFTSRVYDGGASTTWNQMTWTASVPSGTSLQMFERQGNTPYARRVLDRVHRDPDERDDVGGSSRYIQYRADLATTVPSATPVLQDVHISCNGAPDVTPPVITNVTATPGAGATAVIGWTTDELATSRVDYGTSPDSLSLSASSASLVATHALTLTGLAANTTYYFRVTSVDASSNSATSPIRPRPPRASSAW